MKATHQKTVKELKNEGFKSVNEFEHLYINEKGKVYSTTARKYLKPTARNYIKTENKYLNVPKLVLMTFKGEKYKSGQIYYIDGNKENLHSENVKYSRLFTPEQNNTVNTADLLTCIRCYFEVDKKYKIRDNIKTRLYLQIIIEKRDFFAKHKTLKHIEVYLTYLGKHLFEKKSLTDTAKTHFLTTRDCLVIINEFTNLLISEVLQDLKNGYLHELEYKPNRPTKTDEIRQINHYRKASGQKPLPLKKKSVKQSIKDFEKYVQDLQKQD